MKRVAACILLAGLTPVLYGADVQWKYWAASAAVHAAGTSADAYSSWHQVENNRLLCGANGQFGARGVGFKIGTFAAVTGVEYGVLRLTHSRRAAKAFIVVNFVLGTGYGAIAARNFRVQGDRE